MKRSLKKKELHEYMAKITQVPVDPSKKLILKDSDEDGDVMSTLIKAFIMSEMERKQYLHYFHQNKIWYYWLDDSPAVKAFRPVELKAFIQNAPEHIATKKEIKDYLHSKYPDAILVHTMPYHMGSAPGHSGSGRKK